MSWDEYEVKTNYEFRVHTFESQKEVNAYLSKQKNVIDVKTQTEVIQVEPSRDTNYKNTSILYILTIKYIK